MEYRISQKHERDYRTAKINTYFVVEYHKNSLFGSSWVEYSLKVHDGFIYHNIAKKFPTRIEAMDYIKNLQKNIPSSCVVF